MITNLNATLQRIDQIQHRLNTLTPPQVDGDAAGFDAALKKATNQAAEKVQGSALRDRLTGMVQKQANAQQVDPNLVMAVIQAESGFNAGAVSPAGAQGLMQLMPGTAAELGVNNSFDPEQNVQGGTKYLKGLISKYESLPKAIAAYNAGPGAVDKFGGVPPYAETTQYVDKVLGLYKQYSAQQGGAL